MDFLIRSTREVETCPGLDNKTIFCLSFATGDLSLLVISWANLLASQPVLHDNFPLSWWRYDQCMALKNVPTYSVSEPLLLLVITDRYERTGYKPVSVSSLPVPSDMNKGSQ